MTSQLHSIDRDPNVTGVAHTGRFRTDLSLVGERQVGCREDDLATNAFPSRRTRDATVFSNDRDTLGRHDVDGTAVATTTL